MLIRVLIRVLRSREGTFSASAGNEECVVCAFFWDDPYRSAGPLGANNSQQCECAQTGGFDLIATENGTEKCLCASWSKCLPGLAGRLLLTPPRTPPEQRHLSSADACCMCSRCPMGQSLVVAGDDATCLPCASGEFSDSMGNAECTSCASFFDDAYRTAGPEEATSPEQCECQAGGLQLLEHANTTACRCPPGEEMVVEDDQASCRKCSPGTCAPSQSSNSPN